MVKTTKAPRQKHVPLRTCVVCRQVRGKRELVRVVRTPAGNVQVDLTGKLAGRGAYLCRAQACWGPALKGNRLSAALKAPLTGEDAEALAAFAATLPETLIEEPSDGPARNSAGLPRSTAGHA